MKYFICSDIHSFYDELIEALNKAGFDKDNPDHTLAVAGDLFDRGPKSKEVFDFLSSLERCVFIRGNHELLFLELAEKEFPQSHDFSNGTVKTFCQLAGYDETPLIGNYWALQDLSENGRFTGKYDGKAQEYWQDVVRQVKKSAAYQFVKNKSNWKNYLEIGEFVIVHSFIPLINMDGLPPYYINDRKFEYNPHWRVESDDDDWVDATWGCPYKLFESGYFKEEADNGKVLVCGHWSARDFHDWRVKKLGLKESDLPIDTTFINNNLIALDGCTVLSHIINVIIIDSDTGELTK